MLKPTVVAVLLLCVSGSACESRLRKVDESDKELARFFKEGRKNGPCLVRNLKSADSTVRLNAQRVIRTLNDPEFVQELQRKYREERFVEVTLPIPAPLNDSDYHRATQLKGRKNEWYYFAAALDQTIRGQELAQKFEMELTSSIDSEPLRRAFLALRKDPKICGESLQQQIAKHPYFALRNEGWRVRQLAESEKKDKRLFALEYPDQGLTTEWWNLVLRKEGNCWAIESLIQTRVW